MSFLPPNQQRQSTEGLLPIAVNRNKFIVPLITIFGALSFHTVAVHTAHVDLAGSAAGAL